MDVGEGLRRTVRRWMSDAGDAAGDPRAHEPRVDPLAPYVPPTCELCGRRLMLGEPLDRFRAEDRVVAICPVCEPEALSAGYVRVHTDDQARRWYAQQGQVARVDPPATERTAALEPNGPKGRDSSGGKDGGEVRTAA